MYPSAGKSLSWIQELGGFGTATFGAATEIRFNPDGFVFPLAEDFLVEEQPNAGYANSMRAEDEPITYRAGVESALTIPINLRAGKDNATAPPFITMLESAGANEDSGSATTIDTYTSVTAYDLDADEGAIGRAILVELSSGLCFPQLIAAYSLKDVTPSMALPSATEAGKNVYPMWCCIPTDADVAAGKTLGFRLNTRASIDGSGDENWCMEALGCSMAELGVIKLTKRGTVQMTPTFHVAKFQTADSDLAAASLDDTMKYAKINDDFEFGIADYAAGGAIARTVADWMEVEIDTRIKSTPQTGEGSDDSVGGWQWFSSSCGDAPNDKPTAKITMPLTKADYYMMRSVLDGGEQTFRYLHFIQPTDDLSQPAWGIFMPQCYLTNLVADHMGKKYVDAILTYKATAAEYGADESNGSRGMAPIYICGYGDPS